MPDRVDTTGAASAGSQLQTQLYVNQRTDALDDAVRAEVPELAGARFEWRSPVAADNYREYWDAAFLKRVGLDEHAAALEEFWPTGGPHWDALAVVHGPGDDSPGVLLVESKSYPNEMLKGSGTASPSGTPNRELIEASLAWTRKQLGVADKSAADWTGPLYQNANRVAHLLWLRSLGIRAWLVHLLFTGDEHQPTTPEQWTDAVALAEKRLGLNKVNVEGARHLLLEAGSPSELSAG